MDNCLVETRFVVQIRTTRGTITIECEKGSKSVGYHYKPIGCMDPYHNGSVSGEHGRARIKESLRRSWIDPTLDNVEQIVSAAALVLQLATGKPESNYVRRKK